MTHEPAPDEPDKNPKYKFLLIPFAKIRCSEKCRYLIKDIIPRESFVLLWGEPKSCKTFVTFEMAMHVAAGQTFRGYRVKQGPVVWVAAEGAFGMTARIEAFKKRNPSFNDAEFYFLGASLNLVSQSMEFGSCIERQAKRPVLIVLDTLNRTMPGSESSDEDMAKYIKAADGLRARFRCTVLVIHHCGHEHGRPRGHSSLLGAVDGQIKVARDKKSGVITMLVERMKDGNEGTTTKSILEIVDLGHDEDGKPITSCVVKAIMNAAGEQFHDVSAMSLSPASTLLLQELKHELSRSGQPASSLSGCPADVGQIVPLDTLRRSAYARGISRGATERAKQQAFKRALDHLVDAKLAGVHGVYVYLLDSGNG